MKKKLRLLMTMLLLAVMGSAWAQDVTLDLTDGTWGFPTSKVITATSYTNSDGYTITVEGTSGNGFRVYSNPDYFLFGKQGASITLPAFDFDVEKIVVGKGSSSASTSVKTNIFVDDVAVSSEATGSQQDNTFEIAERYQSAGNVYRLQVTSAHNAQATSIKIYKVGSSTPTPTISITPANITVTGDESVALNVEVANYDGEITFTSDPVGAATVTKDATGAYSVTATANAVVTATLGETGVSTSFNVTYQEPINPEDIRWSEDFSSENCMDGYTVVDGGSSTKIYPNDNLAGGEKPELLISKSEGSFTATIDLDGYSGNMTLTFKANYDRVSVSAEGGTVGTPVFANKEYSIPITVEKGTPTLTLTFTNTTSSNVRVDDFLLTGGTLTSEIVNFVTAGYKSYVTANAINWDEISQEGVEGYQVTAFSTSAVTLTELGNDIITAPETPIILKGVKGKNLLVIADQNGSDISSSNLLKRGSEKGNYTENIYVLQKSQDPKWSEDNPYENYNFYRLNTSRYGDIKDRQAFLVLSSAPGAGSNEVGNPGMSGYHGIPLRFIKANDDEPMVSDDAGIIDGINGVEKVGVNGEFYSISGVRVAAPTKGLYIVNGKKVLVK